MLKHWNCKNLISSICKKFITRQINQIENPLVKVSSKISFYCSQNFRSVALIDLEKNVYVSQNQQFWAKKIALLNAFFEV